MADIQLLTDEDILDYTRGSDGDHIITNHYDLDLTLNRPLPIQGGVFDTTIFGSPYVDRCLCNKINPFTSLRNSKEPCPCCGVKVFGKEEALRRFGRIELPFYYLNDLRFNVFKELFQKIFEGVDIKYDFISDMKSCGYTTSKLHSTISIKVFDSCQFNYNAKKKELIISEVITDEKKCSYEGLMKIINEHFPSYLGEYQKLINRYYIVMPSVMRPFNLVKRNNKTSLGLFKLNTWYQVLIRFCCATDTESNSQNYDTVMSSLQTPGEKVRYQACLRAFINGGKKLATELLNSSKENLARDIYAVRTKNSARCPIIPSTTLAIDEIGIPTQIAYEMCREGFIKYLMKEINFTEKQAKDLTKSEDALHPETQKLFKEYAEKQIVLEMA